jgi:hypothetical protein
MKLLVSPAACLLLAGCSSPAYQPPPRPAPRDATHVGASTGQAWDAVIDVFAARNIPIRTVERASGLIVTDALRVGEEGSAYASCGNLGGKVLAPDRATYNILIRGDSTEATVRTTVLWSRSEQPGSIECASTYIWERALETEVKARAERQARLSAREAVQLRTAPPDQSAVSADPPVAEPPTIRTADELMENPGFHRALSDAQRLGIVSGYNEIAIDTLAVELADLALTSAATDRSLNGLFLAYRGTTGNRPGSAMELFHDGLSVGWYNKTGLVWGAVR